jgi:hypothetical protein
MRAMARRGTVLAVVALLLVPSASALAAKPAKGPKPPKSPPTMNVTAVVNGFTTALGYQVHAGADAIESVSCSLTLPDGSTDTTCDTTPDKGSGAKLTKYSISAATPKAGSYTFDVAFELSGGASVHRSTGFSVQPGPAVRFSVSGLVQQDPECWAGDPECFTYGPGYPRQIARIAALDVNGNVATGYAGTVTFKVPGFDFTPPGLTDIQLTSGVGFVPVVVPQLGIGVGIEPMRSACPGGVGHDHVLTAADTVDPTIFGCQTVTSGGGTIHLREGWLDDSSESCASGCFLDPTGNITINTNDVQPISLTSTIAVDDSLTMMGATLGELYFTQSLTVGRLSILGTSIPLDSLALCALCTSDISYFADTSTGLIDPTTGLVISELSLQTDALVVMPWEDPDDASSGTPVTVVSFITQAELPTCYADSQLTIPVGAASCH